MNWLDLFTSIDGRISRKPFWIGVAILTAIELIAYAALGDRWSSIVSLIIAYPEFAVLAKRGHDRNVPTWVIVLFFAAALVLNLLVLLDLAGPLDAPSTLFTAIGIPAFIMFLILLADFGFRRGNVGANRYGPDPLAQ
jgi:uncharacterized membrane protein YhaH (DUF805 family)